MSTYVECGVCRTTQYWYLTMQTHLHLGSPLRRPLPAPRRQPGVRQLRPQPLRGDGGHVGGGRAGVHVPAQHAEQLGQRLGAVPRDNSVFGGKGSYGIAPLRGSAKALEQKDMPARSTRKGDWAAPGCTGRYDGAERCSRWPMLVAYAVRPWQQRVLLNCFRVCCLPTCPPRPRHSYPRVPLAPWPKLLPHSVLRSAANKHDCISLLWS